LSSEIVDVSGCKRNLVVEVPAEQVDLEIEKLAQNYARKMKVPGFRPGKVPLSIIKQRFGSELRNDATQDIIQRHWKEAISDHDLEPLAEPVLENVRDQPGDSLRFTLSFEVLPKLEVKDYTGVAISLEPVSVEDADVDRAIEVLRDQHAEYVPVDEREIRDGDFISAKVDGEFEGGGKPIHEDDVTLIVGDPGTHEAFTENLRGARAGETRSFVATYPADYERKRFAGKNVRYDVAIKEIKEKQLAELEDFAKNVGSASVDELRAKVRDELITKARQTAEKNAREAALDEVLRRNSFDVPECLIQDQLRDNTRRIAANLARQGIDVTKTSIDWRKVHEQERPHAEQAVKRALVLDAIARQEGIEVGEEELEQEFQNLAEMSHKSAAAVRAQFEKDKRIQGFTEHLRNNKALDFIYRNANISGGEKLWH
jgi:trigger factor